MRFQRDRRRAAYGFDDRHTQADIRHELAIHDVDMNTVGPCPLDCLYLLAQSQEIRSQYRRSDLNHKSSSYCAFAPATIATIVNRAVPPTSAASPNFVKLDCFLFLIVPISS